MIDSAIAHYEAIEYAWKIGKKAKSIKAYREALRKILWLIHESTSHTKGPEVNFKDLLDDLPIIPDPILEALTS